MEIIKYGKNVYFDFEVKKEKYFFDKNLSTPFALTNELRDTRLYSEWTPAVIEQRQRNLMASLQQMWRL